MKNKFRVLEWDISDYPEIESWWTDRRLSPEPVGLLPGFGMVAEDENGKLRAACWAIVAKGGVIAHIYGLITDPKNTAEESREAGSAVINALVNSLETMGSEVVFAYTEHEPIANEAIKLGFAMAPKPVYQLVKLCS